MHCKRSMNEKYHLGPSLSKDLLWNRAGIRTVKNRFIIIIIIINDNYY